MPRVLGMDPGTVTIDVCGLAEGEVFFDRSFPTEEALANPEAFVAVLEALGPLDLAVGPSGYGLPLTRASDATQQDLKLAFLAAEGEEGGIGGLRRLARALGSSRLPVIYTPGVVHLSTVPSHRKLNRVDLGTADKVCAAALGIWEARTRKRIALEEVSFILLELGGAFTAGVAVEQGRIVDGFGGTSGPLGWQAAGALDGEVAFLSGTVTKDMLFHGGVETVVERRADSGDFALLAYIEGAVKAASTLRISAPSATEILLSGRMATDARVRARLEGRLGKVAPPRVLQGFAAVVKQGAQGAAIIADGLAAGPNRDLVERLAIREARGTALDYLYWIPPLRARQRLGLA